ncbi:nucleoid-associated protein, YbaB/EbfC family [Mycoplasmopsis pullorum]|uniref:YbaB/EbfC family nucleoid-associated protein n=1 Tax=Mycoplasmopsis pullorum TaxID=48003 RepID=UPI00111BB308|nr:YbaB/EbfC family nucleoid-associated protein [Mycoplasmopsis pullorum]TNK82568.1 nucleoid-associated protein, YbaB/EbfC family [Mycoplasmopsis pullorum]TNK82979.1 nucleoid-associated protein, YbaB/EbfC family [Mycoplasmopsis pullorum]TNK83255.1 nucleoid-associated protein, YbaB/EbfC family [Mycoplasmopsis pullorum]TNK84797.1 nucleoid-associated protein, YbaB/EbfC family [Mycoplasmopsis pullorum]TNK85493.1 nucleoid-associated protein, YbaB/EbfC family [Mycoplasmopsis pullorum]
MNPEMIKRLKKMQAEMEAKQKELESKEFTVKKQGIEIIGTGDLKITKINIDEMLIDPDDKELLEDLLMIAINELTEQIQEEQEKLAPQMPGGMPF